MPILTPPPIPFEESKVGEPPTFNGKASEFPSVFQQCKLYIQVKLITFKEQDAEFHVDFIILHLCSILPEWHQALLESISLLLTNYNTFLK